MPSHYPLSRIAPRGTVLSTGEMVLFKGISSILLCKSVSYPRHLLLHIIAIFVFLFVPSSLSSSHFSVTSFQDIHPEDARRGHERRDIFRPEKVHLGCRVMFFDTGVILGSAFIYVRHHKL